MKKHKHNFTIGKSKTVRLCKCGRFIFINLKPEQIIKEGRS